MWRGGGWVKQDHRCHPSLLKLDDLPVARRARIPSSRVSAYATSEYLDFFYLLDWAREARVSRLSKMVKVGGIALRTDNSSRGQI
jgi:hypothetical protein